MNIIYEKLPSEEEFQNIRESLKEVYRQHVRAKQGQTDAVAMYNSALEQATALINSAVSLRLEPSSMPTDQDT